MDSYRCVITVERFVGLYCISAPHHPEDCGAPSDAAQHPEELYTIESISLDLFLEHSSDS